MVGKNVSVVFHMLAEFEVFGILQPRLELGQDLIPGQLHLSVLELVSEGHIRGHTRRNAPTQTDDLGLHLHQGVGFGVQTHQSSVLNHHAPALKILPSGDAFVA